ncbi:MAG: sulfatase-like hydrolase/transferase [Verrucomicrobiaceae bacterium]|nr:sulfatase-like hydrolase/transferase [Verrucomicrobiaceae bacterium]
MKRLLLALILLPLATFAASPPNILFILADDLGYGDLGCYGAPDIRTPHLDGLAKAGMRFTDFYANGAVCSPTRTAFLTGRYQQRYGLDNALYYQETGRGLPEGGKTIATRLKSVGYATGLSGKWHVGYDHERQPLQQGFDHFFGLLGGNHHYFQHMDRVNVPDLWLGNEAIKREGYTTDLLTGDALAFIEANREKPFFLCLSHAAPHFPWQGPGDVAKDVRPKQKSWQIGDRETYIAMVERMDERIGEVLARLDKLGLVEKTLVVFTSDNGGHTYSRNAPLQGYKSTLWEGGIRVPCIARWPGKIPAGVVSEQVGITMDWTATFLGLAGAKVAAGETDGMDLTPSMVEGRAPSERTLFWRSKPGPVRKGVEIERAVRRGDWKYLQQPAQGIEALFDLRSDPAETKNRITEHPEVVNELRALHEAWDRDVDVGL